MYGQFHFNGYASFDHETSPCVKEICKVRCYRLSPTPPLPILCVSFLRLFPILSYFSLLSLSLFFNSRKKGGRTGLFSRVYHVTCIYIYIYIALSIYLRTKRYGLSLFIFILLISIDRRCDRVTREVREQVIVVCSEKYPFRTKLVVLLFICMSSVCMTVSMPRKIWIMIFRRGLREEGGIRLNFEKRVIIFFNYRPHLFHLVVALHAYCDIHR